MANHFARALVLDPSRVMQLLIEQQLRRRQCEVFVCSDIASAVAVLAEYEIDLVLAELHLDEINGLEFLLWLHKNRPYLHLILISSEIPPLLQEQLQAYQIICFQKSRNFETLMTLIDLKLNKRGIDIATQDMILFELAQLAVLSNQDRHLQISEPLTGHFGYLWFRQGRIIEARHQDSWGEDALVNIMRMEKGTFQELQWNEPENPSIQLPFDALMMGIATLIDSQTLDGNKISTQEAASYLPALLVVEPEIVQRKMLEQHFLRNGFSIDVVENAEQAHHQLAQKNYDVIILDLALEDKAITTFLESLHDWQAIPKMILTGKHLNNATAHLAMKWGILKCYQKPLILGELESFLRYLFSQRYFSGKIRNINILDFLQVVSFGRHHKTYRIHDLAHNEYGKIFIEGGNVTHVSLGNETGLEAFVRLIRIQRGLLTEITFSLPEKPTIDLPMTRLIMRVMSEITQVNPTEGDGLNSEKHPLLAQAQTQKMYPYQQILLRRYLPPIYLDPPGFAGIRLNETTKDVAIKYLNGLNVNIVETGTLLHVNQIGLKIVMSSTDVVEEMMFDATFKGKTHDGLAIGDDIQQAVFLYGSPRFQTEQFYIWGSLSCLHERGKIIGFTLGSI